MKHVYFISYNHKRGYGNHEVTLEEEIKTNKHIMTIEEGVEKNDNVNSVRISNFIKLRTEE